MKFRWYFYKQHNQKKEFFPKTTDKRSQRNAVLHPYFRKKGLILVLFVSKSTNKLEILPPKIEKKAFSVVKKTICLFYK